MSVCLMTVNKSMRTVRLSMCVCEYGCVCVDETTLMKRMVRVGRGERKKKIKIKRRERETVSIGEQLDGI